MRPMLRVLPGIIVGLGYGVLVGGLIFVIDFITGESDRGSVLMLDSKAILRFLILMAMIITGSAGALLGLIVTVLRAGKLKAAMIGFSIGLVILVGVLLLAAPTLDMPANASWSYFRFLLLMFLVLITAFPAGLAATGVATSAVAAKFVSTR
jgi:hypothetical protein